MSITMEERLYRALKRRAGPRGMSRFIAEAVRDRLRLTEDTLYHEYLTAQQDVNREKELHDWDAIDTAGW